MREDEVVALLGSPPSSVHQQKVSRIRQLTYNHSEAEQIGAGSWVFWIVAGSLYNFEFHGGSCPTFPEWFEEVAQLEISSERLRSEGFTVIEGTDGDLLEARAGSNLCQAIFFEDDFRRLIFAWSGEAS